ncbi:hypothetical protein HNR23_001267 [Nocardiopsis mwathae]|uniref:C4-type zinc ribbon domain-containing protein n=1 Tax=Nocardiopsis mwathae TaxID=1472723 RepID=A0A7W9YFM3_9ACTN|nr:hypothetical protein [Nocardiopsis mwathae]
MKAEPADQKRLLDLQEVDSRIRLLTHRLRTLPETVEVQRLEGRVSELRDAKAAAATRLGDLDREQRKAESDVDQVRARAERDNQRLNAGQVSSPKELERLQSEIASLHRRQTELEEVVLEVMERREAADAEHARLQKEIEAAEAELEAVEERRSAAVVDIEADLASAKDRRGRVSAEVPEDLLALYTKLRAQYDGIGAAMLRYGRCEGCKLALSTAELGQIRQASADEVLRCEDCRRILVRTTESGL